MADWKKIKAEYITGDLSYRQLADKYGVPFRTLSDRAKKEQWVALRAKHRERVVTKSCRRKEKSQVESIVRLKSAADKMVKVLDQAAQADYYLGESYVLDQNGNKVTGEDGRFIKCKTINAKGYRAMVAAMRDLTDVVRNLYELPVKTEQPEDRTIRVEFKKQEENGYGR